MSDNCPKHFRIITLSHGLVIVTFPYEKNIISWSINQNANSCIITILYPVGSWESRSTKTNSYVVTWIVHSINATILMRNLGYPFKHRFGSSELFTQTRPAGQSKYLKLGPCVFCFSRVWWFWVVDGQMLVYYFCTLNL